MADDMDTDGVDYCVALTGDDRNPGTRKRPFLTIERARDAVRGVNRKMSGDIVVWLEGGTHRLDRPVVFDHRDSGANGHRVIYRSRPGERAIVSGGRRISGWRRDPDGRWSAPVDAGDFRQLYVNGVRAARAGGKVPAGLTPDSLFGYYAASDEMAGWSNQDDIEFCYYDQWCHTRCPVSYIKKEANGTRIRMVNPYFTLAKAKEGMQINYPAYIENVYELLDEPGEWYLNRKTGRLYYLPRPGEEMESVEVIAPRLEKLVELRGTLDNPVRNISFDGLIFAHATWLKPSRAGLIGIQANFTVGPESNIYAREICGNGLPVLHWECTKSPANIVCHATRGVHFRDCVFEKLGGAGIDLEFGAQDNVISRCEFRDISGTAIQVGDVQGGDHHPEDERMIVRNNTIENNRIHDSAVEYQGGVGIFAGYTDGTIISHNEVYDLPYTGISVGWGWGELDAGGGDKHGRAPYAAPTPAGNNRVEYNHVHHISLVLGDAGGVYTLGNMPGTVIKGNWIHDNPDKHHGGIYLDEGSGFIEVTGNVVYNVTHLITFNNHSQNRIATCREHDNYFGARPGDADFPVSVTEQAGVHD